MLPDTALWSVSNSSGREISSFALPSVFESTPTTSVMKDGKKPVYLVDGYGHYPCCVGCAGIRFGSSSNLESLRIQATRLESRRDLIDGFAIGSSVVRRNGSGSSFEPSNCSSKLSVQVLLTPKAKPIW